MNFPIDPKSTVPLSDQIAEGIRFAVATGRLAPGERLPGVRVLARDLLVNPNTVAKVYRDLEREGVLRTRPGSGAFVASRAAERCRRASHASVVSALRAAVARGVAAGLSGEEIARVAHACLEEAGVHGHVQ
ncbi:MAG: GntR family transcriptional regulator [Planctomycetes bacterium]|nr:GntR family transcriptional regulator [Planctomycetota bacterium]